MGADATSGQPARPDQLCGQLAEVDRLKVFAAVVLGADTPASAAAAAGLAVRTATAALRRLSQVGLVETVEGRLVARPSAFKDAVRVYNASARAPERMDPDDQRDAVLRAFIVDGRLTRVPAAHGKRRIVLEHIAAVFEPGVRYTEKTVNTILRAWYADYATLRRYLVDEDLMARAEGMYWRVGGYVEMT
jgi:hypothetical protein